MNRRFRVVLLLTVGLLLIGGCEPNGSEFLMNARDFLGVDSETFRKRLKEQFIVEHMIVYPAGFSYPIDLVFKLKGQGVFIAHSMTNQVDFPDVHGEVARFWEESKNLFEKSFNREAVII